MSKPIKDFSLGKIKGSVWENEYNGKPTYSVSFQKSYKDKEGNWKNTNFFTLPELRDLYSLVGFMITKQVKEFKKEVKSKPEPDMSNENDDSSDVPF